MSTNFKRQMFEQLAKTGKAFSNPNRIELLELLAQSEKTVDSLAQSASLSIANTSQHLQILRDSGLVTSSKNAQFVTYKISSNLVVDILMTLRKIADKKINIIESNWNKANEPQEIIVAAELKHTDPDVLVIDIRPEGEYQNSHIQNAVNIPLEQLEQRITELPKNKQIVAYSRGPYCVLSRKAVTTLQTNGYQVKRLKEGFTHWTHSDRSKENDLKIL